ncbi:hypothetical protein N7522_006700 [Penicillium canescens]|nr:hypothetical protein N7522_006700 [Penicillium canescens]
MQVRTLPAPVAQVTLAIQATMVLHTVHIILMAVALGFSHTGIKSIHPAPILGQKILFTIIHPSIGILSNLGTLPTHHQGLEMDLALLALLA